MLKQKCAIVFLSLLACFVYSNSIKLSIHPGHCPELSFMKNLDVEKYLGTWYVYAGYLFPFEVGTRCNKAIYTPGPDNKTLYVSNTQVDAFFNPKVRAGNVTILPSGELQIRYKGIGDIAGDIKYKILETDYNNYTVLYYCSEFFMSHIQFLWIRTREPFPNQTVINDAMYVIAEHDLSLRELQLSDQTGCSTEDEWL